MGSDLLGLLDGAAIFHEGSDSGRSKGVAIDRVGEAGGGGAPLDQGEYAATVKAPQAQSLSVHGSKQRRLSLISITAVKARRPQVGIKLLLSRMMNGHVMEFSALNTAVAIIAAGIAVDAIKSPAAGGQDESLDNGR